VDTNKNVFAENLEREVSHINEKEFELAYQAANESIENFNSKDENSAISYSDILNIAGNIALTLNKVDEARSYFEKAFHEDPNSSEAYVGLAEILFIEKNYEGAKTMFEIGYSGNNVNALEGFKKVNAILAGVPDHKEIPMESKNIKPEEISDSIITEAYDLFKSNKYFESLNKLLSAEKYFNGHLSKPTNAAFASAFFNLKGYNYLGLNKTDDAKKCFERALSIDPNSSEAYIGLAEILFIEKDYESAKSMFELGYNENNVNALEGFKKVNAILANVPDNNEIHIELGNKKQEEISDNIINEAYDLFKSNKFIESLNKLLTAEKYFNGHLSKQTNAAFASAFFNLKGYNYLGLNKTDDAKDCFERALILDPISSDACAGLGHCSYLIGDEENAKAMFEFAVNNNPENSFAIESLAKINVIFCLSKDHNSLLKDNTEKLGENLSKILSSVFQLFELKKYDEALETLLRTEQLFYSQLDKETENHLISSYENLKGLILLILNKADKAQESFELALNINPVSSQACAGIGEAFSISGKDKEAKIMYEWAVKNNPENKFAVEGLGKINSLLGFEKTHTTLVNTKEKHL